MSLGIGAVAKLVLQDDTTVIYEYGGFNWNETEYKNLEYIKDGLITIDKSCFAEPEIHQKLKRMPSGRKRLVTKKIPVSVDFPKMIEDGLIEVQNCSHCWKKMGDKEIDAMALKVLFKLFYQYQEEEKIPEYISILS